MRRRFLCGLALGWMVLGGAGAGAAPSDGGPVTVFAAASLQGVLHDIAADFTAATGTGVRFSFAGSSLLARQIILGAPADVFIAASRDWMDAVQQAGAIAPDTRTDLAGNALVLIAHDADAPALALASGDDLAQALGGGRLAMALVDAVPAGQYGKAALIWLGQWARLAPQVVQADNARAALALVASGAAPFGVVYATDALAEPRVHVIARFPPTSHPAIVYPAARVAGQGGHRADGARAFLDHLQTPRARAIWARWGFVAPGGGAMSAAGGE